MNIPNATLALAAGLAMAASAPSVLAQTEPFPAEVLADDLDGTNGFAIDGIPTMWGFGFSVSDAGDLNGDGVGDFIVGKTDGVLTGAAYVVFGTRGGFPAVFDLEDLDGSNGFRVDGFEPGDRAGRAVASAGDVNGDGVGDVIFGSDRAGDGDGRASVVFGKTTGFPAALSLADLNGEDGFTLVGEEGFGYEVGSSVARAGDINGDGIDDIIVGSAGYYAPSGTGFDAGRALIIFGKTTGFDATIPVGNLNGANGFAVVGTEYRTQLGLSVASAGDINGDGFDDAIIGSTDAPEHPYYYFTRKGSAYVIYGRDTAGVGGFPPIIRSARLSGFGFEIRGDNYGDGFGQAVAPAGDLNGDGVGDLIIGAPQARRDIGSTSGVAYVVYGRGAGDPPFPEIFEAAGLQAPDGVRFEGLASPDRTGVSVAGLGDINGDGRDDVAVGAPGRREMGATHVVYGRADDFPQTLLLETMGGVDGFRIRGEDTGDSFGFDVSPAGDVNGDGIDDIIGGDRSAVQSAGVATVRAYVIYGKRQPCRADLDGDGRLTLFDFLAFQNAFDAGDPIADFDGDGSLTLFDFLAFQNEFDAGCE